MLVPSRSLASCFANKMLASLDCPAEQGSQAGQAFVWLALQASWSTTSCKCSCGFKMGLQCSSASMHSITHNHIFPASSVKAESRLKDRLFPKAICSQLWAVDLPGASVTDMPI